MTKNRYRLVVAFLMLLCFQVVLLPHIAQASNCRPREDNLQAAEIVFSGKVVNITHVAGDDVVLFNVLAVWKGVLQSQATVYTGDTSRDCGTGNCGYHFKRGSSYLVFAYDWRNPRGSTMHLVTDYCSRTDLLSAASQDLAALGPSGLPVGGAGPLERIQGFVAYLLVGLALVATGLELRVLTKAHALRR